MKKTFIFIALSLFCIITFASNPKKSRTRYYRHEINVSIGGINPSNSGSDSYERKLMDRFGLVSVGCSFEDGLAAACHSKAEPDLGTASTLMTLSYYYHINKHIALGGYFNYVKVEDELGWYEPYIYDTINGYPISWTGFSYVKGKSFFLMPAIKFSWLNNRWCSLYSKASCGINYQTLKFESEVIPQSMVEDLSKNKNVRFAYTFTPFGWEIGKQKVRWFIEWGLGSNTNIKMGLSYRFKRF